MNKQRRKRIEEVTGKMRDLLTEIEIARDEEEEYRNNIPENLQGSERYEKTEEYCDGLNEFIDTLESAFEDLDTLINE